MITLTSHRFTAIAAIAVVLMACGGGSGGPSEPSGPVLQTVEVAPTVSLFNTAPGNTVALSVTVKDNNGATLTSGVAKTFASDNTGVAMVAGDGTVTAAGLGTAHVTVTAKAGNVTKTASTTVSVQAPPADASVTAPALLYEPGEVHVTAGGTVTWTFGPIHHTVTFTTSGAPNSVGELLNGSESRTFTTPGTFTYQCNFHVGMVGKVHVH